MYKLITSMRWSDLRWDASWEKVIEINELLPKVGDHVEISIDESEDYIQQGKYSFLWLPPHSEYNGLDDRPYEFLKGRVIAGEISNIPNYKYQPLIRPLTFKFHVQEVVPLLDLINKISDANYFCFTQHVFEFWKEMREKRRIQVFRSENVIYFRASYYTSVKAVFLELHEKIYLVYHSYSSGSAVSNLTKIELDPFELEIFDEYFDSSKLENIKNPENISNSEVEGLAYY